MMTMIELLIAIERSEDITSVMDQLQERRPLAQIRPHPDVSFLATRDELLGASNGAEGHWFNDGEALDAETCVRHCLVIRHVLETNQPFFWNREPTRTGRRYRFGAPLQGVGLHGLQGPMFGHNGLVGAVYFGGEKIDGSAQARLILTQLGTTAFLTARRPIEAAQQEDENAALGTRARGAVDRLGTAVAEVADTLGLSERTVENHPRRIRQRPQVKTTAQAIGAVLRSRSLQS